VWPVIAPLFAAELYRLDINLPGTQTQVANFFVALILLMGCINVAAPQYYTPAQNTGVPGSHQIASASHAEYIPEETPVYTDLVHGSELLLQGTHDYVISGETIGTEDGNVAISPDMRPLFGEWKEDERAYTVVTARGKIGIRTWGGAIPRTNNDNDHEYQKIYSNGQDYWYQNNT
jgi:hypothetical protein